VLIDNSVVDHGFPRMQEIVWYTYEYSSLSIDVDGNLYFFQAYTLDAHDLDYYIIYQGVTYAGGVVMSGGLTGNHCTSLSICNGTMKGAIYNRSSVYNLKYFEFTPPIDAISDAPKPTSWFRYTNPDGERGFTVHVKTDGGGNIQIYAGSDLAVQAGIPGLGPHVQFKVLGYYDEDVDFTETWDEFENTVEQSWEDITLSGVSDRVVEVISVGEDRQVGIHWKRGTVGEVETEDTPQGWIVQEGAYVEADRNPAATPTYPSSGTTATTWLTGAQAGVIQARSYDIHADHYFLFSGYFHAEMKYQQIDPEEGLFTDGWGAWKAKKLLTYDRVMSFKQTGCPYADYWEPSSPDNSLNNIVMGPISILLWHGEDSGAQWCGARKRGSVVDRRIAVAARQLYDTDYKGNAVGLLTGTDDDGYFTYYQQSKYLIDAERTPIYGAYTRATGIIYWQWYSDPPAVIPFENTLYRTPDDITEEDD